MSLSGNTGIEVRTTGSDTNGGGFNAATGVTDYTQQDAAQLSLTDLATSGAGVTTLTSVTGGFTAAMVGNLIRINSGTNFQTGWYEITAYTNTNTVTLDRTPTSGAAGSGGNGKVGGALASPGMAGALIESAASGGGGMDIHIQAGTYTLTSSTDNVSGGVLRVNYNGSVSNPTRIIGYQTTREDMQEKPIIHAGARTGLSNGFIRSQGNYTQIFNIEVNGNSGASNMGLQVGAGGGLIAFCKVSNCPAIGVLLANGYNAVLWTEVTGCGGTAAIHMSGGAATAYGCAVHGNTTVGIRCNSSSYRVLRCLIYSNTGASSDGIQVATGAYQEIQHNTVYGNGRHGLYFTSNQTYFSGVISDNIFSENAGYGIGADSSLINYLQKNNAYYNNTSGARDTNADDSFTIGAITLTADPFTSKGTGDFSLNRVVGGGAECRQAASLGAFGSSATTGYLDIGAVQSPCNLTESDNTLQFGSYVFPPTFYITEDPFQRITGSQKLPRADGGRVPVGTLERKRFVIRGKLIKGPTNPTNLRTRLDELRAAVHDGEQPLYLWEDRYYRNCQLTEYSDNYEATGFARIDDIFLAFETGDPFQYSEDLTSDTWAVSASGSTRTITSAGNAYAYPKLKITVGGAGSQTIAYTITNQTTGEAFTLSGTVTGGQVIEVDCLEQTVVIGSTDYLSLFDGQWLKLNAGGNSILEAYSSGTITQIVTEYRDRWW